MLHLKSVLIKHKGAIHIAKTSRQVDHRQSRVNNFNAAVHQRFLHFAGDRNADVNGSVRGNLGIKRVHQLQVHVAIGYAGLAGGRP